MCASFKDFLLNITDASFCEEIEVIQSLWSGYGRISRYKLSDSPHDTVVVKYIALEQVNKHPRGWDTDRSHIRKVKSYQVETHWYQAWSHLTSDDCRVPRFVGSFAQGNDQWNILEDLNAYYPSGKYDLDLSEVKVCLKWLANFHATFLGHSPEGLWEVGTYWHLATRPDEFNKIKHQELKSKAYLIDEILNNCQFKTIVHGDAKLANFCFSSDGRKVAAVDFQYVGGGCGMKDVAYFLGSCLSSSECELYEEELLKFYFSELQHALVAIKSEIEFNLLREEWVAMYPIACADFTRFMLGWMPTHHKINPYNLKMVNSVLSAM